MRETAVFPLPVDQEMRQWECSQTDRHTDRQTDATRFYNLSHAICYSYGTDKNHTLNVNNFIIRMLYKNSYTLSEGISYDMKEYPHIISFE